MLDQKTITAVTKYVEDKFPEVSGSKPSVRKQNPPVAKSSQTTIAASDTLYLITYQGSAHTPEGKSIPRFVRVVVNNKGKIIKITTSR